MIIESVLEEGKSVLDYNRKEIYIRFGDIIKFVYRFKGFYNWMYKGYIFNLVIRILDIYWVFIIW